MTQLEQKFVKVRNSKTGAERLLATGGMYNGMHLLQDEYEVPFKMTDAWVIEKLANLIKARELASIKARLENMDDFAMQTARFIPDFSLAELGKSKYPNNMSYEEANKFRVAFNDALSFYGIAIQYLERGHSLEDVEKLMKERHWHHCNRDGVQEAFADQTEKHKALLDLV
jgi:hypothetical protein